MKLRKQGLTEYIILLALMAIALVLTMAVFGSNQKALNQATNSTFKDGRDFKELAEAKSFDDTGENGRHRTGLIKGEAGSGGDAQKANNWKQQQDKKKKQAVAALDQNGPDSPKTQQALKSYYGSFDNPQQLDEKKNFDAWYASGGASASASSTNSTPSETSGSTSSGTSSSSGNATTSSTGSGSTSGSGGSASSTSSSGTSGSSGSSSGTSSSGSTSGSNGASGSSSGLTPQAVIGSIASDGNSSSASGSTTGNASSQTGVVSTSSLNVRKEAGTKNAILKKISKGTEVTILEKKVVGGIQGGISTDLYQSAESFSSYNTFYAAGEKWSDPDTDKGKSSTDGGTSRNYYGLREDGKKEGSFRYATPEIVGVVAVDPKVIPYGSIIERKDANGNILRFIAGDTGGAVRSRKAAKENGSDRPVVDIFLPQGEWNKTLSEGEDTLTLYRYKGSKPYSSLSNEEKNALFKGVAPGADTTKVVGGEEWYKVRLADGTEGWVSAKHMQVKPVEAPVEKPAETPATAPTTEPVTETPPSTETPAPVTEAPPVETTEPTPVDVPPYVGSYDGTTAASETTETRAWIPVEAPVSSDTTNRSVERYNDVLNQFAVGVNPRYARRDGNTYCNIFVWDATSAMGAELPHWVDSSGNSVGVGKGRELDANGVNTWLHNSGETNGWRMVTAEEAQANANQGRPSVVSWKNSGGIGHIGMVRPGEVTEEGPSLAQAGGRNFNEGHVQNGFGSATTEAEYWIHD